MLKLRLTLLILGIFVILGAFFRLYRISDYATFLGDEGRDALVVKRMIVDHRWTLLSPTTSVGNLYLGPAYYYLMLPPLWVARLDPVGPAIMVALLGTATIYLIYWLGKRLFNTQTGLMAAGLYAVSQPIIDHTRFSWNPNPMPFFVCLVLLSLLQFRSTGRSYFLAILGFCLGIIFQLHYLGAIFIVSVVLLLIISRPRINLRHHLVWFSSFLLALSPLILFELRHGFVITKGMIRFLSAGEKIGFNLSVFGQKILYAYERLFGHFITTDNLILGSAFGLLSLGIILIRWRITSARWSVVIMLLWLVVGLLGVGLYQGDLNDHYLGFLFPVPFLMLGYLLSFFRSVRLGYLGWLLFGCLLIINVLHIDAVAGKRPNYQIHRAQVVGKSIADSARSERFNIALISPTMDFRAMNYRYFAEINGAVAQDIGTYDRLDSLYVVVEDPRADITQNPSWEISTFGPYRVADQWRFEEFGYRVYKLVK